MKTKQSLIFWLLFGVGCFVGLSPLTWGIHETGHLRSFTFDGIWAEITAPNKTATSHITENGLAAGALAEFATAYLFCWLLLALSKRESMGIRRFWFPIGFPLGAATVIFFKAFFLTDFNREWSSEIKMNWIIFILPFLILFWICFVVTRLIKGDYL